MPGMPPPAPQSTDTIRDGTNNTTCPLTLTFFRLRVKIVLVCNGERQPQSFGGIASDSLQYSPNEAEHGWIYLVGSILPSAGQRNRGVGLGFGAFRSHGQQEHTTRCCLHPRFRGISYTNGQPWEHSCIPTEISLTLSRLGRRVDLIKRALEDDACLKCSHAKTVW